MCGNILAFMIGGMIGDLFGGRGRHSCCGPVFPNWPYMCSTLPYHGYDYEDTGVYLPMPTRLGVYDYLLDPNYTLLQYRQYLQSRQNTHLSNLSIPGLDQLSLSNQNQQVQSSQSTQSVNQNQPEHEASTEEEQIEERKFAAKYNDLAKLLNLHKNILKIKNRASDREIIAKIEVALEKTGTSKEKYEALTKVYKDIDKAALKRTLIQIAPKKIEQTNADGSKDLVNDPSDDTPDYKTMLEKSGYHYGMNANSDVNTDDTAIMNLLDEAYTAISKISDSNISADALTNIILTLQTDDDNDILRVLSLWNDKYKTNNNRSILRHIKAQMPCCTSTMQNSIISKHVQPLVSALVAKANHMKTYTDIFTEDELKTLNEQSSALNELNSKVNYANMDKLINKFETLYVTLRNLDAKRIKAEITDRYSFLNDIAEDDEDIIVDTLITEDTTNDIKSEELSEIVTLQEQNREKEELARTLPPVVQYLVRDGVLIQTDVEGVYKASKPDSGNSDKVINTPYYLVKDGQIYLMKNVESIENRTANDGFKYNISMYVPSERRTKIFKANKFDNTRQLQLVGVDEAHIRSQSNRDEHEKGVEIGKEIQIMAKNNTTHSEELKIVDYLNNSLSSTNVTDVVFGFRKSYNENKSGDKGIVQQLSGEDGSGHPTIKDIRLIIDRLLEAAEEVGITTANDSDARILKTQFIDQIGTAQQKAEGTKKYSENEQWESWAIIGKSVSETIDGYVYSLTKKVRVKLNLPTVGLP